MKIGILTYHRSHNFGALLQAVALRSVLTTMGHNATFVDYWPSYHEHVYAFFSYVLLKQKNIKGKLQYLVKFLLGFKSKRRKIRNTYKFIDHYIFPYMSSINEDYDILVYGSDQIWRKQPELNTYNPVYFGDNDIKARSHISYAASMGIISHNKEDKDKLNKLLSHLNRISVRETDLCNLVCELGFECKICLDPTLLITGDKWISDMHLQHKSNEKYLIFYKMRGKSFDEKYVQQFARLLNLKLKILYPTANRNNTSDRITTANPIEFLELIYNAEFVITSSYHGLVFALLFHKPFYASFGSNAGRAQSLLEKLELKDRLLEPMSHIPENGKPINYSEVDKRLNFWRKDSLQYLADNC